MTSFLRFVYALVFVFSISVVSTPFVSPSHAQSASSEQVDIQPVIDNAKENGMSVIVISPPAAEEVEVETGPTLQEQALKVRSELFKMIAAAPDLPSAIYNTLAGATPEGGLTWLVYAILIAVAGIAIGTVPAYALRKMNQERFRNLYSADVETRAEKITYLMLRALIILFNLSIMAIVAIVVAIIFDFEHRPTRGTIGVIIGVYMVYRIFRHVVLFNMLAPDTPSHRLINLTDEQADSMQRLSLIHI